MAHLVTYKMCIEIIQRNNIWTGSNRGNKSIKLVVEAGKDASDDFLIMERYTDGCQRVHQMLDLVEVIGSSSFLREFASCLRIYTILAREHEANMHSRAAHTV